MEKIIVFLTELDKFTMLVSLLMPMTGILALSLLNQLRKSGFKRLVIFYGAMLMITLVGARFGLLAGSLTGVFAGMLVGIFICRFSPGEPNIFVIFIGMFTGVSVGNAADLFGNPDWFGNPELSSAYLIFIICTCLTSFLLVKLLSKVWEYLKSPAWCKV